MVLSIVSNPTVDRKTDLLCLQLLPRFHTTWRETGCGRPLSSLIQSEPDSANNPGWHSAGDVESLAAFYLQVAQVTNFPGLKNQIGNENAQWL